MLLQPLRLPVVLHGAPGWSSGAHALTPTSSAAAKESAAPAAAPAAVAKLLLLLLLLLGSGLG